MQVGVATALDPRGPYRPAGGPLLGRLDETIDPFVYVSPDGPLLYWSQENSLRVAALRPDGLRVMGPRTTVLLPIGEEGTGYDSVVEGVATLEHDGRFYLFSSGDRCCAPDPHYAVMVARGESPWGPFERSPHNPVVEANDAFVAPGHVFVLEDEGGATWLVYHAIPSEGDGEARVLMLDRLGWSQGWPVVENGEGPSSVPRPAPSV
jgi:arabinan endo-1,5-alpha-L-arabinosidase